LAALRKFMWFLLSKFARKCKFTRLQVINILTFAASFAKYLLHTGHVRHYQSAKSGKFLKCF